MTLDNQSPNRKLYFTLECSNQGSLITWEEIWRKVLFIKGRLLDLHKGTAAISVKKDLDHGPLQRCVLVVLAAYSLV